MTNELMKIYNLKQSKKGAQVSLARGCDTGKLNTILINYNVAPLGEWCFPFLAETSVSLAQMPCVTGRQKMREPPDLQQRQKPVIHCEVDSYKWKRWRWGVPKLSVHPDIWSSLEPTTHAQEGINKATSRTLPLCLKDFLFQV